MQKRSSIIPAKSTTIGGISFYYSEGELRIRKAAGPTKKHIRTKASCASIRENNTEFGCASHVSKMLRLCIGKQLSDFADSYISARLTGLFRTVILRGEGYKGKRSFDPCRHHSLLRGFECNRHRSFSDVWKSPVTFSFNGDSSEHVLHTIVPSSVSEAPAGATHVRLALFVVSVSGMQYDACQKKYLDTDMCSSAMAFKEKALNSSQRISLQAGAPVSIELRVPVPINKTEKENAALLLLAGVTYFCGDTRMREGAAMHIGEVLV